MNETVHDELVKVLSRHLPNCDALANQWSADCTGCDWGAEGRGTLAFAHKAHRAHVAGELMAVVEQVRNAAGAEALEAAAAAIYNGAGDPEQELYDHGASPWLTLRALYLRAGA